MWMTSWLEAMGWGFWNLKKNSELRFRLGQSKSIFGARRGQTSSLWRVPHVVDSDGKVRRERNCVSLSLLMSKNLKLKKVNKSFAPEPKKSRKCFDCFRIPIRVWTCYSMNIMNVLCMWISWSYFWTWIYYIRLYLKLIYVLLVSTFI